MPADSSVGGSRFDRGRALNKLQLLGAEARKLVSKMDNLILPEMNEVANQEKYLAKKEKDHKKAL